jgi:hypothetical protein
MSKRDDMLMSLRWFWRTLTRRQIDGNRQSQYSKIFVRPRCPFLLEISTRWRRSGYQDYRLRLTCERFQTRSRIVQSNHFLRLLAPSGSSTNQLSADSSWTSRAAGFLGAVVWSVSLHFSQADTLAPGLQRQGPRDSRVDEVLGHDQERTLTPGEELVYLK